MISRKPFVLILVTLLALTLVSCDKSSTGTDAQSTNITYNSSSPTAEITPSINRSVSNTNRDIAKSIVEGIATGNVRDKTEEEQKKIEAAAANNQLKSIPSKPKKCLSYQRSFNGHPQLEKITQDYINDSCEHFTNKVYLRGGKVCELPKGKIRYPMAASAEEILQAIDNCIRD